MAEPIRDAKRSVAFILDNPILLVGIVLSLMVYMVANVLSAIFGIIPVIGNLISILVTGLTLPLLTNGVYGAVKYDEPVTLSNYVENIQENYLSVSGVYFVTTGIVIIGMLVAIIPTLLVYGFSGGLVSNLSSNVLFILYMLLLGVGIIIFQFYIQFGFTAAYFDNMGPIDALKKSMELVGENVWDVFWYSSILFVAIIGVAFGGFGIAFGLMALDGAMKLVGAVLAMGIFLVFYPVMALFSYTYMATFYQSLTRNYAE